MSVFDTAPTTEQVASTNEQLTLPTSEDWVTALVKEKGEQWQEPQTLAKGYVHAQNRIAELEANLAQADKNDYAKDLLEQFKAQAVAPSTPETVTQTQGTSVQEDTTPKTEDIEGLIQKALTAKEKDNTVKQNLQLANSKLVEEFGTDAGNHVNTKAKELGMSVAKLEEIASESPSAFLNLMGTKTPATLNTLPRATVNTSANLSPVKTGVRDASYYRELRLKSPQEYRSTKVQMQMMKDAKEMGPSFRT